MSLDYGINVGIDTTEWPLPAQPRIDYSRKPDGELRAWCNSGMSAKCGKIETRYKRKTPGTSPYIYNSATFYAEQPDCSPNIHDNCPRCGHALYWSRKNPNDAQPQRRSSAERTNANANTNTKLGAIS